MEFLNRRELAERWGVSQRFIDRRRQQGLIPWVDLALGKGKRPLVRFRLQDVEAFEKLGRLDPTST